MSNNKRAKRWFEKLSPEKKAQWQQAAIERAHERKRNDPKKQNKIDAQAYELLAERVAIFGSEWHINSAVRIPAAIKEAIAKDGTDVLLLILDRENKFVNHS